MHPSSAKFKTDLAHGEAVEARVAQLIARKTGAAVVFNPEGKESRWDFRLERRDVRSYEVKSHPAHARTGNVFYEVEYRGKPSGLRATQADWWVDACPPALVVLSRPKKLLDWLAVMGGSMINGGDDMACRGWLVPSRDLLKLAETAPEWIYVLKLENQ